MNCRTDRTIIVVANPITLCSSNLSKESLWIKNGKSHFLFEFLEVSRKGVWQRECQCTCRHSGKAISITEIYLWNCLLKPQWWHFGTTSQKDEHIFQSWRLVGIICMVKIKIYKGITPPYSILKLQLNCESYTSY